MEFDAHRYDGSVIIEGKESSLFQLHRHRRLLRLHPPLSPMLSAQVRLLAPRSLGRAPFATISTHTNNVRGGCLFSCRSLLRGAKGTRDRGREGRAGNEHQMAMTE